MTYTIWIIVHLLTGTLAVSTTKSTSLPSGLPPSLNNATCPFRTINYITHTLPQKCLATNRLLNNQSLQELSAGVSPSGTSPFNKIAEPTPTGVTTVSSNYTIPSVAKSNLTSTEVDGTVSARSPVNPDGAASASETSEEDSALESGSFLSFEEWKKQNLKKAGQSEHVGSGVQADFPEPRKRPINVQNALDSLGDDVEIDIDFTGFVSSGPEKGVHEVTHPIAEVPENERSDPLSTGGVRSRSKDAGTTCKERFNYASFDCAANILKTNREAKSSNAILLENKDAYMLNQCAAKDKFIILELCNDIQIDTIVLANFEFFSSTFRTFRVSVSDRYPVRAEKWKTLGVFEARNSREVQAFLVENPVIWARYVRLEFLTHYGKEFYCPISLLRVHGTTMLEEYKHDMDMGIEDENEEQDPIQDEGVSVADSVTTEVAPMSSEIMSSSEEDQLQDMPLEVEHLTLEREDTQESKANVQTRASVTDAVPPSIVAYEAISAVIDPSDICVPKDSPVSTDTVQDANFAHSSQLDTTVSTVKQPNHTQAATGSGQQSSVVIPNASSASNLKQDMSEETSSKSPKQTKTSTPNSALSTKSSAVLLNAASATKDRVAISATDKSKQSSTPPQPPPAVPTIQESFFKSVQKRLQMLEANSSLSLQYIEDQSRALRDAFKKVEQRQLTKTTGFLDQLNSTVLNELREFRQQYDQLWQSTVIELETQRERYERDTEAINARLGLLADEVIFQRRMGIVQMVLILVCLVLVLFSRGSINNYLELPLVQNVLSRSPSTKWLNLSNRDSPAHALKAGRSYKAYQSRNGIAKAHRRMHSEDSITDTQSGPEAYAPLTPVSFDAQSDAEFYKEEIKIPNSDFEGDGQFDDPVFDPSLIERPSTSPPVLRVNDMSPISEILHTSDEEAQDVQVSEHIPELTAELSNGNVSGEPQSSGLILPAKHLSWDLPTT